MTNKDVFSGRYKETETAFGTVREYIPKVVTTTGTVYQDQLPTAEQSKAQEERNLKAINELLNGNYAEKLCPYRLSQKYNNAKCRKDCTLFCENGCRCSSQEREPMPVKFGNYCPISGTGCTQLCAMYNNGCTYKF